MVASIKSNWTSILVLILLLSGCKSTDSYWSFPTSRALVRMCIPTQRETETRGPMYPMLVAMPVTVVLDILLLPATIPHDIWLSSRRSSGARSASPEDGWTDPRKVGAWRGW